MVLLKNCTPEFVRSCFPEENSDLIFDQEQSTIFLIFGSNVFIVHNPDSERISHRIGGCWIGLASPTWEVKNWNPKNGILTFHAPFQGPADLKDPSVGSKRTGKVKQWYWNGEPRSILTYDEDGRLNGERKEWRNGMLWNHMILYPEKNSEIFLFQGKTLKEIHDRQKK